MALKAEQPILAGTNLARAAMQSPNFVTEVSGWIVRQDGSAEFNNVVIRGGEVIGGVTLEYSGTPAAGNLIYSVAAFSGTDAYGNHYLGGGSAWYGSTWAVALQSVATLQYYSGSLAAGWTPAAAAVAFASAKQVEITGALIATTGTAANPTLIMTDTWQPITLDGSGLTWTTVSGYAAPSYRLLPDGNLQLTGLADWGSTATTSKALNSSNPLVAPYVPATTKFFRSYSNVGQRGSVQIDDTGVITMECNATSAGRYCEIDAILPLGV